MLYQIFVPVICILSFLSFSFQENDSKQFIFTEEYDFIIIGSGPAGSVIANRLSEVHDWKILLLEAGKKPNIITDIPSFAPRFQFTDYNWGYLTEKQQGAALGLIDGKMAWPRGKVVGGSSVINYMLHVRGNKEDYDNWEALGNPGWAYEDLLPLFKKSEDSRLRHADSGYHNTNGSLSVQDDNYKSKSSGVFIQGALDSGYEYVDYNGKRQLGVSFVQATTRRGARCSAEKAFLRNILYRPNLSISTESHVIRLVIDANTKKTHGVEFHKHKKCYRFRASKEVILSAGAINSPQILILSGVGPADHLNDLNISVVQNLPVGKKIYDHLFYSGLVFTVNESIVLQPKIFKNPLSILRYLIDGTGPLSSLGGAEGIAFLKTNVTDYKGNYPDIELLFVGGGIHTDRGTVLKKVMRISDEIYNELFRPLEKVYAWSIWPVLLHPKSHGYLKLKSKNPFKFPILYGNYFTDPNNEDIKTLIAAIREVQRIVAVPFFKKYATRQVTTMLPGCKSYKYDSDDYWECALRHLATTVYHQTSTCKMGPSTDPEAVVDNRLRVYGLQNLRVVDASIFPTAVSAHTAIPTYVVGEKAAKIIKEDWSIKD